MRASRTGLLALACAAAAFALPAQTVAITGGTVYPVSGPVIKNGTVVIVNGKITAVGANVAVPAGATKIDATGKWVTPGFVNSSTVLGLVDVGFGADANESGSRGVDDISASFQPWLGYNPLNALIPAAREGGITTIAIWPNGNLVGGQGAMIDLFPGSLTDVTLKGPIGMVSELEGLRSAGVGSRGELVGKLEELFAATRQYIANKEAYNSARMRTLGYRKADLDAMIPVVNGTLPFVVQANSASDIQEALRLSKQLGFKLVLYSASEGWMVAKEIAAAKVPVLTGAMNNIPRDFTELNSRQDNASILRKAGVTVVLVGNAGGGDEENFNVKNVRFEAGNAVGYGMTWDDALRAVTLAPAEVFGVAGKIGALKAGMEGNVVVWSGDPFEFSSQAEHVFVRGLEYSAPSRKDLLTERYKNLPPDYTKP